jgi:glycosyltransferase involved in cell wall biosynthesis
VKGIGVQRLRYPKLDRIAYLSGPVDGVEAYYAWRNSWQLKYFGDSHILGYFQLCNDRKIKSYLVTTLDRPHTKYKVDDVVIENLRSSKSYGVRYYIDHLVWTIAILTKIIFFRPQLVIMTQGLTFGMIFSVLRLFGVKFVVVLACTLWPKFTKIGHRKRLARSIVLRLNSLFFTYFVSSVVVASDDITQQVRELVRRRVIPVSVFLPVYDHSQFAQFSPPRYLTKPFRVLFAGRIEANKGVFDLVAIAQRLQTNGFHGFHFDVCGDGSKLGELRERVESLNLSQVITCHGFCDRPKLTSLLQESHVVIVPTTTAFIEGFNMVCAESILAGRPVITSAVCPALQYVRAAAVEVQPDDVDGYYEALLRLANDQELYEAKVAACRVAQEQFYDPGTSWKARMGKVLDTI